MGGHRFSWTDQPLCDAPWACSKVDISWLKISIELKRYSTAYREHWRLGDKRSNVQIMSKQRGRIDA